MEQECKVHSFITLFQPEILLPKIIFYSILFLRRYERKKINKQSEHNGCLLNFCVFIIVLREKSEQEEQTKKKNTAKRIKN